MSDEQLHVVQQQVVAAVRKVFNLPDDALRFEAVKLADDRKQSADSGVQPEAEDRSLKSEDQRPNSQDSISQPTSQSPTPNAQKTKSDGGASLDDIADLLLGKGK
jgi:hypothetical protein